MDGWADRQRNEYGVGFPHYVPPGQLNNKSVAFSLRNIEVQRFFFQVDT